MSLKEHHTLILYADDIESLKQFFETFGLKFDVIVGHDGYAHFISQEGRHTFKLCPEHRRAFRGISGTQGLWHYKMEYPTGIEPVSPR